MSSENNIGLQRLTRGENPLFSFDKHILAVGNPSGENVKNAFKSERTKITDAKEKKLFQEEGLDDIDPNLFYRGGVSKKRHHTMRKNKILYKRISRRASNKRKHTKHRRR
jgi:hypothetical protein